MLLKFTKMHGAGNDFVMLDGVRQRLRLGPAVLRRLADRRFGIGCDQVLVVEATDEPGVDFVYRIFNADGNEVEQCGNGSRCFVRFVREQGLTDKRAIRVRTACGIIEPVELDDGRVRVDMGPPRFEPADLQFDPQGLAPRSIGDIRFWPLPVGGQTRWVALVSMGNPHAVQLVDDVDAAAVAGEGPAIERHPRFARGVNAGFAQIVAPGRLRLRVWERGVGETLACGTGACAAAVVAIATGRAEAAVKIETRGGELELEWHGANVAMTGAAETVFEGRIELPPGLS